MIVIDIETVKRVDLPDVLFPTLEDVKAPSNYKDADKIKEYSEKKLKEMNSKMSLDSTRNQVCSYALLAAKAVDDTTPTVLFCVSENETDVLQSLATNFTMLQSSDYDQLPVITFNGGRFDLGNLVTAFMRRKIPIPDLLRVAWLFRYDLGHHLDMYKLLGENGSLHDWSHALGIQPPVGKGDMVQGWFDGKDFESIKTHNVSDVWATWEIYQRWAQ